MAPVTFRTLKDTVWLGEQTVMTIMKDRANFKHFINDSKIQFQMQFIHSKNTITAISTKKN